MAGVLTDAQTQLLVALCFFEEKIKLLPDKVLYGSISSSEIDELCELISNEFLMRGIEESFEPDSYGLELESLLDAVNRMRPRITT